MLVSNKLSWKSLTCFVPAQGSRVPLKMGPPFGETPTTMASGVLLMFTSRAGVGECRSLLISRSPAACVRIVSLCPSKTLSRLSSSMRASSAPSSRLRGSVWTKASHSCLLFLEAEGGGVGPQGSAVIAELAKITASVSDEPADRSAVSIMQNLQITLHKENARALLRRRA